MDALMDKYNLHNVTMMVKMWNERKTWVSAYWKVVFYAGIISIQRSESMNSVLKRGFVKEEQDLHIFAQQVNNSIQTQHEAENAENVASAGVQQTLTSYEFKEHAR